MKPKVRSTVNKDQLKSYIVLVSRCTAVKDGGPQISFRVFAVVGDGAGSYGFASGKSPDISNARQKALRKAARNLRRVHLRGGNKTLYSRIECSYGATKVVMLPSRGTGIRAGGAARSIFQAMGVEDVVVKIIGSTNSSNVLHAISKGLSTAVSPRFIAEKRGKTVAEILGKKPKITQEDKEMNDSSGG